MKKLFIGAVQQPVQMLPSVAAVMHAPPANACPAGQSLQNESPLVGPRCAPSQNNNLFPQPGQHSGRHNGKRRRQPVPD